MLKDITLGQYFPGNSVIHRLDPRTKLIVLVVYMVTLFVASGWVSYGVLLLFLLTVIKISAIPGKSIVRGMKPLVMILVFTGVLNLFFNKDGRVLVDFWGITITTGRRGACGLYAGAYSDAGHCDLPADLHHLAHLPDGRAGKPDESAEGHQGACP